jgi:drug/metabolite transporter superfamily protein YnfA
MKYLPLILKHLRRNWIRTASTVLAMAACIFLFCTLQSVLAEIDGLLNGDGLKSIGVGAPIRLRGWCGASSAAQPISRRARSREPRDTLRRDRRRGAGGAASAAVSLGAFAWPLTLHPFAPGRTYAAYGGIYVAVAMLWLCLVHGTSPDRWDPIGATVSVAGMAIIAFGPRP